MGAIFGARGSHARYGSVVSTVGTSQGAVIVGLGLARLINADFAQHGNSWACVHVDGLFEVHVWHTVNMRGMPSFDVVSSAVRSVILPLVSKASRPFCVCKGESLSNPVPF